MGAFTENTGISYQDLTFKLNFPTRKAGTFSIWGIGLLDMNKDDAVKITPNGKRLPTDKSLKRQWRKEQVE